MAHLQIASFCHPCIQVVQILPGSTTAMVADAPAEHSHILIGIVLAPLLCILCRFAHQIAVTAGQAVDNNGRIIKAFPRKCMGGQVQMIALRTHAHIPSVAALAEDLHYAPTVTECVKIHGNCRLFAEFLGKIVLAAQNLPQDRFAAGNIAVRL